MEVQEVHELEGRVVLKRKLLADQMEESQVHLQADPKTDGQAVLTTTARQVAQRMEAPQMFQMPEQRPKSSVHREV